MSEHQHPRLPTRKEEKEWNEEIYPIKAPEQKISESKNHKAAETISPKNGKLHVEKTPGGEYARSLSFCGWAGMGHFWYGPNQKLPKIHSKN